METDDMTIDRCRDYCTRSKEAGRNGDAVRAIEWLLAALEDGSRVIDWYEMEVEALYCLIDGVRKRLALPIRESAMKMLLHKGIIQSLVKIRKGLTEHETDERLRNFKASIKPGTLPAGSPPRTI